jgi:hypothetical protein
MKPRLLHQISIVIFLSIIITACNIPSSQGTNTTQAPLPSATSQAIPTMTQLLVPTSLPTHALPTSTSKPTATSTPEPTVTSTATPASATCTDLAKFVEDVTVPDDTEMLPGQDFIKTWRLQNAGTCTWTNHYSLVFVSGDQMEGTSPLPLTGSTAPGAIVDISVNLKAPGTPDTYRGDWDLKNAAGVIFGLGSHSTDTFYVKIKVVEGLSELNLGAATWTDNFDNTDNWYLLDTANTKWTAGDGKLVMTSIKPAVGEEWAL